MQVQKAIDAGVRIITQGNGSSVAARDLRVRRQVQRAQPRQGSAVPQLRRGRSRAHQRQVQLLALPLGRQLRHEDGGADQLHEGQDATIKKVYLINQDYSFGQAVRARRQEDAEGQAPRHPDRRRRAASAAEDHRLRALHRQDQGLRRRHVITGNWGQDIALLLKAAADAGLQVNWYTYYAGGAGGPTARQADRARPPRLPDQRRLRQHADHAASQATREGVPRQVQRRLVLSARGQSDADARRGA